MADTTDTASTSSNPPPSSGRRSQKVLVACDECKAKKRRCSGTRPVCTACAERSLICVYGVVRRRGRGKKDDFDARIRALEMSIDQSHGEVSSGAEVEEEMLITGAMQQESVTSEMYDQNAVQDNSKRPFFLTMANDQASVGRHGEHARRHAFRMETFVSLPSEKHMAEIFETEFGDDNAYWPIPDVATLMPILHSACSEASTPVRPEPAPWAMLNVSLAIAIRARAAPDSHRKMTEIAWLHYKNAFAVVVPIAVRSHDVLGLEATLAMAIFLAETSDTSTLQYLLSVAHQLIVRLEPDRPADIDVQHDKRCRAALYTYCILAQDMAFAQGFHSMKPSSGRSNVLWYLDPLIDTVGDRSSDRKMQDLRLELLGLQRKIDALALSRNTQDWHALCEDAKTIDILLTDWMHNLSGMLQAERAMTEEADPLSRMELSLRFTFMYTRWTLQGFIARLESSTAELQTQATVSQSLQYVLAGKSIDLAQSLVDLTPGQIWSYLHHPLSAVLSLFAAVIQSPLADHASDHLVAMRHFLRLLQRIRESGALELERMLMLCCNMVMVAGISTSRLKSGRQDENLPIELRWYPRTVCLSELQDRLSSAQVSTHAMYLARGLMGNLPGPRGAVIAALGTLMPPEWHGGSTGTILGPDLVKPETYDFAFDY